MGGGSDYACLRLGRVSIDSGKAYDTMCLEIASRNRHVDMEVKMEYPPTILRVSPFVAAMGRALMLKPITLILPRFCQSRSVTASSYGC